MPGKPIKRGRGSSIYDFPDHPLTGGFARPSKAHRDLGLSRQTGSMLEFGERLAKARGITQEIPPPDAPPPDNPARSPSLGQETTTTEQKGSPLARPNPPLPPPPSSQDGPSSSLRTTTIKRLRSSSGSPSRKELDVEDPPVTAASASVSTSPTTPAVPSAPTMTTVGEKSASKQEPPGLLSATKRRCLVNYSDSEDE